ncbi:MAG: hypothetical protein GF384_01240 [Elusimicrobia bacterium]|nr:hypothetical protein [Elusimicrobiota bacterium]MBD3411658.1 hypothetical protein [Elusimicrobiota bacterium]
MLIRFDNGYVLAYSSKRMLGAITAIGSPEEFINTKNMGPDALSIELDSFRKLVNGSRKNIKSTLMDQSALAGIGNIYSDEILFQAGIRPDARAGSIENKGLQKLYRTMKLVLNKAINRKADPSRMPGSWLIPNRNKDSTCPKCGKKLKHKKINGRTGYFCGNCQKK